VLDLGDMLYAPNCFRDGQERHIMVAWLQEHASRQASFDYSGCITLPRVLTLSGAPPLHRQSAA
jgi:sucrose-6-phosphate hydrolase SacC (GH32 family)